MLFTTGLFVIFFSIVFAIYWSLRGNLPRQIFLIAASFVFYGAWDWRFLALLSATILIAWATPRLADRFESASKWIVTAGIAGLLGLLAFFKYYGFFVDSLLSLIRLDPDEVGFTTLNIILPVGISFYMFQAISYIVDVRKKVISNDVSLLRVGLYVSFFPQLVAGPIVRASHFIPQLEEKRTFDEYQFRAGLKLILIGFLYKAVFADQIALFVDPIFNDVDGHDNLSLTAATIGFYSQIYFDFAGYSTMAIGFARMLGFWLPRNFDYPYAAINISEFWRKWHISLSSWLRDYLYIQLGGNRKGPIKTDRNLMATMLLGGLWHGASWNFVLWGALHGVALLIHRRLRPLTHQYKGVFLAIILAWVVTQLFAALCWIPFRAEGFGDTMQVFGGLVGARDDSGLTRASIPWLLLTLPVIADTLILSGAIKHIRSKGWPVWTQYAAFGSIAGVALIIMQTNASPFIYFQF